MIGKPRSISRRRRINVYLHADVAALLYRLAEQKNPRDPRRAIAEVITRGLQTLVNREKKVNGADVFSGLPKFPPRKEWAIPTRWLP